MFWPFRRRKSPTYRGLDLPPLHNNPFDEAIRFVLDRASSLAADKQQLEMFSVELDERLQNEANLVGVIGSVHMRAHSHGVHLLYATGYTFFFIREDLATN